jgi:uncharacterized membrane protein
MMSVVAILGFAISVYIFYEKKQKQKLICFLGGDCNSVVNSKYSTFLTIPNEVLGIGYYFAVFIYYFIGINTGIPAVDFNIDLFFLVISLVAASYSIYLTYIQLFILKKTCEYCMTVNLINILILLMVLF